MVKESVSSKYFGLHIFVFCFRIVSIGFIAYFIYQRYFAHSAKQVVVILYVCGLFSGVAVLLKIRHIAANVYNPWDNTKLSWLQKICFGSLKEFASLWNGYEIHGLHKIYNNNTLLVGYHSRSNLDLMYLMANIQCNLLLSHLLFYIPMMRNLLPLMGAVPAKGGVKDKVETSFIQQLTEGNRPLMLLPGGAFECLKRYEDIGKVNWKEEPGFARVIAQERARLGSKIQVVPFYTKHCEDCLYTTPGWYDYSGEAVRSYMSQLKAGNILVLPYMMVTLLFSLGFFLVPLPVKMDTYFDNPIVIGDKETPAEFAKRVSSAMQALIDRTDSLPERPFLKGKPSLFTQIVLGSYCFAQSVVVHSVCVVLLLFVIYPAIVIYSQLKTRDTVNSETTALESDDTKKSK